MVEERKGGGWVKRGDKVSGWRTRSKAREVVISEIGSDQIKSCDVISG